MIDELMDQSRIHDLDAMRKKLWHLGIQAGNEAIKLQPGYQGAKVFC
jgi:hypothetical protein